MNDDLLRASIQLEEHTTDRRNYRTAAAHQQFDNWAYAAPTIRIGK
ncbi:hypothetical protein RMR10_022895 [Agrobacterium rosae]|nr:hypothetical protein [Agrobacterium rosae]MDX8315188.1 hypothetical protein [Agrobacterium rosae]